MQVSVSRQPAVPAEHVERIGENSSVTTANCPSLASHVTGKRVEESAEVLWR